MGFIDRFLNSIIPARRRRISTDPQYFDRRRQSPDYKRRREIVKNFWIVAGLAMIAAPLAHFVVGVSLFTTFLSFMYLDEAPELLDQMS